MVPKKRVISRRGRPVSRLNLRRARTSSRSRSKPVPALPLLNGPTPPSGRRSPAPPPRARRPQADLPSPPSARRPPSCRARAAPAGRLQLERLARALTRFERLLPPRAHVPPAVDAEQARHLGGAAAPLVERDRPASSRRGSARGACAPPHAPSARRRRRAARRGAPRRPSRQRVAPGGASPACARPRPWSGRWPERLKTSTFSSLEYTVRTPSRTGSDPTFIHTPAR